MAAKRTQLRAQLGLLQPGVVPLDARNSRGGEGCATDRLMRSMASDLNQTTFFIHGVNNFNGVDGGFVLKPPVDSISGIRIITHSANAEFGGSLGWTTNIVTRSGTNELHGTLWEFLRNDVFDAEQLFCEVHRSH